jgi:potassium channel subfamily K protein 1
VYLLMGLLMMMLVLAVLYEIPELNLGFHFYLKNENPYDEQQRLRGDPSDPSGSRGFTYSKQEDDEATQAIPSATGGTYQSFQDKDVEGAGVEQE